MTRHRTGGKPLSQPMLTHFIDAYMRRFGRWVSNPYICKKYTYIAAQFAIVCDIYWCKNKSSDKAMKLYIIENNVTEYLFFTWCVSKTLDFVTWVYRNIYHWKWEYLGHCSDVTWASRRLQLPTTPLFVQPFLQAYNKESLEGTGPLWGESTGRSIPITKEQ